MAKTGTWVIGSIVRILFQNQMMLVDEPTARAIWSAPDGGPLIPGHADELVSVVYGTNMDIHCTTFLWLADETKTKADETEMSMHHFFDYRGKRNQALALKTCPEKFMVLHHLALPTPSGKGGHDFNVNAVKLTLFFPIQNDWGLFNASDCNTATFCPFHPVLACSPGAAGLTFPAQGTSTTSDSSSVGFSGMTS